MGRKIGMTETYISAMERGSIYPSDDVISRLSTIFGIRSDWLKTGEEPMFLPGRERPAVDVDGIGERVKKIRKKTGLSQTEFGGRIGFSRNQIYCVEAGKLTASTDFLGRLADEYGVNLDWLLTGVGEEEGKRDLVDDALIAWLKENPDIVKELRKIGGLD